MSWTGDPDLMRAAGIPDETGSRSGGNDRLGGLVREYQQVA
jgi:hypothetical protein